MELLYKTNITHAFVLLVLLVALCTVYSEQHFRCDSLHINCNPECNKHSMEWQNQTSKNVDLNNWTFCCFMTYTFWEKMGMLSPFQTLTFQSQTSQNTAHICCILRRGWGVYPSLMERKGSLLPTSGHHLVKWLICHLPGRMLDPVRQKKGRCNCLIITA